MKNLRVLLLALSLGLTPALAWATGWLPLVKSGGAFYTGPGDIQAFTFWGGLRGYSRAYSTGLNPAIDLVDQANANPITINIKSDGSLDTATIATWVAANSVTTILVAKLYDQTGNGRHVSIGAGARPSLVPNVINSNYYGILFASGKRLLSSLTLTQNQPYSTVVLAQQLTSSAGQGLVASMNAGFTDGFTLNLNTTNLIPYAGASPAVAVTASNLTAYQAVFNGAASIANVNGTETVVNSGTQNITNETIAVGSNQSGADFLGYETEAGFVGSTISAANRILLNANMRGAYSSFGGMSLRENSLFTTGASGIASGHFKFEAEAPFNQVRVWIGNKYTSGNIGTWKALIGNTDTMAINTVDNAFTPTQSGVPNNALVGSGVGWYAVTWDSGAASKTAALAPVTGDSNTASYMHSDWISISSVPRSDVIGGRPACLLRVAQTDGAGPGQYTQATGNLSSYYAARGGGAGWFREYLAQNTSNDAVTTIGNKPASVDPSGGFEKFAWLEFRYVPRTRSVINIGDSRMASAFASNTINHWSAVALRELSTQSFPISTVNIAGSGHSRNEALALLDAATAAGIKVTDVIFQGWSQNGFGQTDAAADAFIAQTLTYITSLTAAGVKIFMTTDYALNGYTGVAEAARLKVINQVRTWASQGLVVLVDTDAILTDYSGGAGVLKAAYDSGDHIHANSTGQRAMSNLLKSVWN